MTFSASGRETFQLRGDVLHNALGQHKNLTRLRDKDKAIPSYTHTCKGYLCVFVRVFVCVCVCIHNLWRSKAKAAKLMCEKDEIESTILSLMKA